MTCEAADPRAEKQLGAQPHTLQSREQVCLRVWGWVGHGSNAVGWGRVVPSNPFSVPVPLAVPSPILWKPSHFCSQLPFTGAGLQCETGERAPLQTAAQAS